MEPTTAADQRAGLIRDLDLAVRGPDPAARCLAVKAALIRAAATGDALLPPDCCRPSPDGYARHLLHRDPEGAYSVVVMVWAPGQGTPLHDHDGKWCVECVYRGRVRVTSYSRGRDGPDGTFTFREESGILADIGSAGALIPPHEYHRIENAGESRAITVHVYESEMVRCNTYVPVADDRYRRVTRELAYTA
jgi:predicted metal-dependent enzyme (double-stranded beta helix superfamily)